MANGELKRIKSLINSKRMKASREFLHILCGKIRFKIALALSKTKIGLNVTELSQILDASLSRTSHQLQILRKHKLVVAKRTNREVVYSLANHRIRFFSFLVEN